MKNRITRSAALALTVICLATVVLLSRDHWLREAVAQSTERPQKWEYCYVSSPFTYGSAEGYSTKVYVSTGGGKYMADSDSTGVTALNALGAAGWELVSASDEHPQPGNPPGTSPTTRFLLKRRK